MKTKIILFLCLLAFFYPKNIFCQEEGDIITLVSDVKVIGKPVSVFTDLNTTKSVEYLENGILFTVIKKETETVQLKALNFPPLKDKSGEQRDLSEYYNDKIYSISRADFDRYALKNEKKEPLSVGILTLPFKARPQEKFSFDTEFNFNSTLNIALDKKAFWNIQLGAGIGSVGLNKSNSLLEEPQDIAVLTTLVGIMIEYERVQVGLYTGFDFINNQANYSWDSHGKLWLGFGIGYDLFSIDIASKEPTN